MRNYLSLLLFLLFSANFLLAQKPATPKTLAEKTAKMQSESGFINFHWEEKTGKIWLEIDQLDTEFLYVNSLPAGVGSNDIGLDRGQLGSERVVKFFRSGNKVLLTQVNYDFRAISDNLEEAKSVSEAFAQSVLWGFKIEIEENGKLLVDATGFFLRDAHKVSPRLKMRKQGDYKLDKDRSAIYLPRTKNFTDNTEFEAMLTFTGNAKGEWIRSVVPSPEAVTVRQHHSFVKLPDHDYQPRVFDPRSGFNSIKYQDYATPISEPLVQQFINRHHLQKKNPSAAVSEAVEPIVYYLDRGAPEPIKSALMEGASWWNQAFEAAGYKDAFQVKELPEGADPMDVNYNLIQWVHRSTRGWSYGSSVIDPRTGEIIKGHVSLGSLRVRQDFLIAQGLIPGYENGTTPDPKLQEMALARLRQLSAHEVGHTIGLAHNFAASSNDRASVMDYPHPYITLDENGNVDFSKAYDDKIGAWDKRTILYGYQDFPKGTNEKVALDDILKENIQLGLQYISDRDARPQGGAHPTGHLWDNGSSPVQELRRLSEVRAKALDNFSVDNIPTGMPMAYLENVLVPIYLAHRYQVEGVAKLIGGVNYSYAVKGDAQVVTEVVSNGDQKAALSSLINTLEPSFLKIPESIIKLIPPQPIGYSRGRELFKINSTLTFDPLAAAESAANHTLGLLLNPARLSRLVEQSARGSEMNVSEVFKAIEGVAFNQKSKDPFEEEIRYIVGKRYLQYLLQLAGDKTINQQVSAIALSYINHYESVTFQTKVFANVPSSPRSAHYMYLVNQIKQFKAHPNEYKMPKAPDMPDGSPIGCGEEH